VSPFLFLFYLSPVFLSSFHLPYFIPPPSNHGQIESQYLSLQILDKLISTRWKVLPADQQQGIRNFIVETIVQQSGDETNLRREKVYIGKLDTTLIQVSMVRGEER